MVRDAEFGFKDVISQCADCCQNLSEADMHFVAKSTVLIIGGAQMLHIWENSVAYVVSFSF